MIFLLKRITPNGFFEICVDSESVDDGGWGDGGNDQDYDCDSVDNPFECIAVGCDWNQDEGCSDFSNSDDDEEELICQDIDNLYVKEAYVGKSIVMKRFRPRAKGRAAPIKKPYSRVTIILEEKTNEDKKGDKK